MEKSFEVGLERDAVIWRGQRGPSMQRQHVRTESKGVLKTLKT